MLEVAQGFCGGGDLVVGIAGDGVEGGAAFERAADDVAGAEADGEGEGEDDAAEEDAEGELEDGAADLEVVEDHGGGEDEDEPLDAEREEARVLELGVDGADEDGTLEEAGDDGAGDENKNGSDGVGDVGDDVGRDLGFAGIGGVGGRDADEAADEDASPEDDAGDEGGGAVGGRPVGDGGDGVAGEALVELCRYEEAAQQCGQTGSDGREDDEREQKSHEGREEDGELYEHTVCGLAESEFDLLPHGCYLGCRFLVVSSQFQLFVAGCEILKWLCVLNAFLLKRFFYGLKRSGQRQRDTRYGLSVSKATATSWMCFSGAVPLLMRVR